MCRCPSKPRKVSRSQERSVAATGQPGAHVDLAITDAGAGEVTRAAKPVPGRAGSVSGRVNRRLTSCGGVGRISPYPSARRGSTRVPSQEGGAVPGAGRLGVALALGVGVGVGVAEAVGVGPGVSAAGCLVDVVPQAARTMIASSAATRLMDPPYAPFEQQ